MCVTIHFWITAGFALLFAIFLVMNDPYVPPLRGPGAQDTEESIATGSAYEMPTVNMFLSAAISGTMPGNNKTSLPLFPASEMVNLAKPYREWATEPWRSIPEPKGLFGMSIGEKGTSPPILRIMLAVSGMEDILGVDLIRNVTGGGDGGSTMMEMSKKVMRTMMWFGMAPVSDARWKANGLDKEENIEEALAVIQMVIDVWNNLRTAAVQGGLRHTFNTAIAEIDIFQDAVKALKTSRGEEVQEWNLTKLWQEYHIRHFDHMATQARSWTLRHMASLHKIWKDRFVAKLASGRILSETQQTIIIDHYAMMILNKMQDMYIDVDIFIRARLEGFLIAGPSSEILGNVDAPKHELNRVYAALEREREQTIRTLLKTRVDYRVANRNPAITGGRAFMEAPCLLIDREAAHKTIQPEIMNPLKRGMESWVQTQNDTKIEKFGFVVYRLAYQENDGEWNSFLEKLKEGLGSGWEGVIGAETMRGKARLKWVDGREQNISQGDLAGARDAFKKYKESTAFPAGFIKIVFLAITPHSIKSFTNTTISANEADTGDYRGFLHAVSADFTPASPSTTRLATHEKQHHSAYDGTFKIIDQLIWTDLFAMASIPSLDLYTYWRLAAQHPWNVYVGPTTSVRRRMWREMNGLLGELAIMSVREEGESS